MSDTRPDTQTCLPAGPFCPEVAKPVQMAGQSQEGQGPGLSLSFPTCDAGVLTRLGDTGPYSPACPGPGLEVSPPGLLSHG